MYSSKVSEVLPVHIIHCVGPYIGTFVEYVSCVLITKSRKSYLYNFTYRTLCRSLHWYSHGIRLSCVNHKVSEVLTL